MLLMSMASASYVQAQGLTDAEINSLTYIREEEKLARDVYLFLGEMWGSRIFTNIAASEQTHMDAIQKLLVKYGIDDPALGQGEFANVELQKMYDSLIEQGSVSLSAAFEVGVVIEETDIADLNEAIVVSEAHKDIVKVYNNLLEGSLRHLDAFNSNLAKM
jgi:hypothetical protein